MRGKLPAVVLACLAARAGAQDSFPFFGYRALDATGAAAVVDLDGDGLPEVVARGAQFMTRVFHNAGNARLDAFTDYASPEYPARPSGADVTGDGIPDLTVLGLGEHMLCVRQGQGAGQFGARTDSPVPAGARLFVLADLTGDNLPDAVADDGAQLILFPGDGSGAFGAPQPLGAAAAKITALAAADLNADGLTDIVALSADTPDCLILLATPGGGTDAPIHLAAQDGATSLALADADADGATDILIGQTNEGGGHPRGVWLYTNDGLGAFAQPGAFTSTGVPDASTQPLAIGVAELSGDGLPDLVVAGAELLLFRGTGEPQAPFADAVVWGRLDEPTSVAFGDLNGDGSTDMVTAGRDCNAFLNDGAGRFLARWTTLPFVQPAKLAPGDLNADGTPDLGILAEVGRDDDHSSSLTVLLSDGAGGYAQTEPVSLPADARLFSLQPIDQNAPGELDIVVADLNGFLWLPNLGGYGQQWLGLGQPSIINHNYNDMPLAIVHADFEFYGNEQNTPDPDLLLVSTHRGGSASETYFHTFRNDGAGGYNAEPTVTLPYGAICAAGADTDADGDTDIVYASNSPSSALRTRLNQVNGSVIKDRQDYAGISDLADVRMLDSNEDGAPDAVVYSARDNDYSGGATLLLNRGDGKFESPRGLFERAGIAFDLGLINDDQWADAVVLSGVASWNFPELAVFLGDEYGGFSGPYVTTLQTLPAGWQAEDVAIVDIDADGQGEVAAAVSHTDYPSLGAVLLLEPRAPDPCPADFNQDGAVNTIDVIAFLGAWSAGDPSADVNHDGLVNTQDVIAFLGAWAAGC
ncbi:MAG: VCBS repeat-containing protein [Phycisphaerales bacterium]|nr:VCBS repeat-containing protein [Phycisphaerales bacterium]